MTYQDWNDELYEANERQWVVNHAKFDKSYIARTYVIRTTFKREYLFFSFGDSEGPYVRLVTINERENLDELVRVMGYVRIF